MSADDRFPFLLQGIRRTREGALIPETMRLNKKSISKGGYMKGSDYILADDGAKMHQIHLQFICRHTGIHSTNMYVTDEMFAKLQAYLRS